jgi:glycosyltransferase involved in cell wall biosynthesis
MDLGVTGRLSYDVVTPARDELENLRRLADSLAAQTVRPSRWVVVDNGSSDGTREEAERFAGEHPWVLVVDAPGDAAARPGAPIVRAFHAGLAALGDLADVVVKVDADVSFPADYFERLLADFAAEPRLGIAGGVCWEREDGAWKPTQVTGEHVRGAARAYRRECLEQLLPLPEETGWDTVDELQASVAGWQTRLLTQLRFDHYRAVGARDGSRTARWVAKGRASHYLGYRPAYLAVRAVHNARTDPAALAMIAGYVEAWARRRPVHPDPQARRLLRSRQRLRDLPARVRELRSSTHG